MSVEEDSMVINYLGAHAHLVSEISKWNISEWPECCADLGLPTVEDFERELRKNNQILSPGEVPLSTPFTLVALENGNIVGTGTLEEEDVTLKGFQSLRPWIASIYVPETQRRKGIAGKILKRLEWEAFERLGEQVAYLWCKPNLESYYKAHGWESFDQAPYLCYESIVFMRKHAPKSPTSMID